MIKSTILGHSLVTRLGDQTLCPESQFGDHLGDWSLGPSILQLRDNSLCQFKVLFSAILLLFFCSIYSQNPNWIAPNPSSFTYNATATAVVNYNTSVSNNMNDKIAFFVGNDIRGLGTPIQIGSEVYHFITLYSNLTNETMQVKVYHAATNDVYNVVQPFQFTANNIYGDINNPWSFYIFPNNNSPLIINNIPLQQTLEGIPFDTINLQDYLVQPDPYEVEWSYTSNGNLIVDLIDGFLIVEGGSSFTGQTTLTVKATELFGNPQQYAEKVITFDVDAMYASPDWHPIPNQGIVAGNQFVDRDLMIYEYQYGGNNLEFEYVPIVTESNPPTAAPTWTPLINFSNTMNITAKIFYTPKYIMHHNDDVLAAFINNEVRGVATQDSVSGLFFLSIASSSVNEPITLKFYSGALKKILNINNAFLFMPTSILGNPGNPYPVDFAPIIPNINAQGNAHFTIVDTSFNGEVKFEFTAYDSIYHEYLHAETETSLCVVANANDLDTFYADADGDGLGNPNNFIKACSVGVGYANNDDDCDDSNAVDPNAMISVFETSGVANNDGNLCTGGSALLVVTGAGNYIWNTGSTNDSITVMPMNPTTYTVTITYPTCLGVVTKDIYVEGNVVKIEDNAGNGSLRNVLFCAAEGSSITYDQPFNSKTILTAPITITKNISINGLVFSKPEITIDFNSAVSGITILPGKKMTLNHINLKLVNPAGKSTFLGLGTLEIVAGTRVR